MVFGAPGSLGYSSGTLGRRVTQNSQNFCLRTETAQKTHEVIPCLRDVWGKGLPPINYSTERKERNPFPVLHN